MNVSTYLDRYHQTSEESYFTQNKLCTLVTTEGRITLTDNQLKITRPDRSVDQTMTDSHDFDWFLEKYFGIRIKEA